MLTWIIIICAIILIGLFIYWQLIITEGAYLGAPLVALMYDWTAAKYNDIKAFDADSEKYRLGEPLANRLHHQPEALVLDVATGTGRIPLALFDQPTFQGQVVGLDRASKMIKVAVQDTATFRKRLLYIQADAMALPFANNTFTAVTCLEALEFFPSPQTGLSEFIRVLAPATAQHPRSGWLLTSNRIGWEAKLMPGKTWTRDQLHALLDQFPLRYVDIQVWQDIYELVWAQKVED